MPENDAAPSPSTSLRLLSGDGIVRVTFAAVLTTDQYDQLMAVASTPGNAQALIAELRRLGEEWGIGVTAQRVK